MGGFAFGCIAAGPFLGQVGELGLELVQPGNCGLPKRAAGESPRIAAVNISTLVSLFSVWVAKKGNKLTEAEIHVEDTWDDRKTTYMRMCVCMYMCVIILNPKFMHQKKSGRKQ